MKNTFNLLPSNWKLLKESLYQPFNSMDDVREFLKLSANHSGLELKGLDAINRKDILELFNFIRIQSLSLEDAFPTAEISFLVAETSKIVLTRQQLLILLCHMTLLTIQPTSRHIYWVNFKNWLTDGRSCAMAYLNGLFSYFAVVKSMVDSQWKDEHVTFQRHEYSEEIFPLPEISPSDCEMHLSGKIGDFSRNILDFANEHIGFGISGTQEEVIFGSFLELCPAMIFCCDAIKNSESIIVRNVVKYAFYDGYGFSLTFAHGSEQANLDRFNIIAIDALDFSACEYSSIRQQLSEQNLARELRKLISGFSSLKNESIDTGHWGCGAYGGNKYVKFLLQIIAASVTGNELSFCCFNDEEFYASYQMYRSKIKTYTLHEIWTSLLSFHPVSDVLDFGSIF